MSATWVPARRITTRSTLAANSRRSAGPKTFRPTAPTACASRWCRASNYPAGFFNVYRCIVNRPDLDAVVHVGDYIYEFGEGEYGAGVEIDRVPKPPRESGHARRTIATPPTGAIRNLQEAHRQFPFVLVWDDHEITNDAWSGGGINHNPERGEGDWATRKAAAYKAYLEWMPIRESQEPGIHLYRTFRYGTLVDLCDDRYAWLARSAGRRQQRRCTCRSKRTLMGAAQEAWMFDQVRRVAAGEHAVDAARPAGSVFPGHASRRIGWPTPMPGTATRRSAIACSISSSARRCAVSSF